MSISIAAKITARYAPFEFSNIPRFPNVMLSTKEWGDCITRFIEDDDDFPTQQLIDFHECMIQLGIFHEDALMKIFMISLKGYGHQWYKSLPVACIFSLKYFHILFHSCCKRFYPVELILEYCCNREHVPQDNHDHEGFTDEESDQEMDGQSTYSFDTEADMSDELYEEASQDNVYEYVHEGFQ